MNSPPGKKRKLVMRSGPVVLVLVLALLAVSCGGAIVRLTQQEVSPSYKAGEFGYAGARGAIRVIVSGDGLGADPPALDKAVTEAMRGRHWGPRTNFTTLDHPGIRPSYRVIMMFNPAPTMVGMRLCREDPASLPVVPATQGIVLFSAFCRGGESMTEIKGRVAGATGLDNPAFAELVGQVTHALFPPDRRFEDDQSGAPPWLQSD
jgi:hypothetical protein